MVLSQGDTFPEGVILNHIPIELGENLDPLTCSIPTTLKLDKLLEENKEGNTLVVALPGAFTPTCTNNHIPPFLENAGQLKSEKRVKNLVVLTANDAFVLNAWGKLLLSHTKLAEKIPNIFFASDPNAAFSRENGLSVDASANGMGIRTARYAILVDNNSRKILYLGKEKARGVTDSGYEAVIRAKI